MLVHNNAKSCNANRFLGRSTGSAGGTVGPLGVAVAVVNKLSPRVIAPFPNEFALAVGHLSWNADLVAVEVVDGMFGIIAFFITLRQRLIAVGVGVNVSSVSFSTL